MKGHAQRLAQNAAALAGVRPPSDGSTRVRVRYNECDPMGVAHHATYLGWLEIARTEMLRAGGVSYAQLEAAGIFLVIVKVEVRYRKPILYDDVVEVMARVQPGSSRVKLEHSYELWVVERTGMNEAQTRQASPAPVAVASTTLACVDREGNIQMLPAWLTTSG